MLINCAQRNGKKAETQENKIMEGEEDDKSSTTSRETSSGRSSETEESSKESEPEKVPKKGLFWRPKTNLTKSNDPTDETAIDVAKESGIKPASKTTPLRRRSFVLHRLNGAVQAMLRTKSSYYFFTFSIFI